MISDLPKMFYGGVERNYDTPHTSLSVWVLLDEGALFHALAKHLSRVKIPNQGSQGPLRGMQKKAHALGLPIHAFEHVPFFSFGALRGCRMVL